MIETLTVSELINALEQFPDDMPVVAVSDYGDRSHTMQAIAISEVETSQVGQSGYSDSGYRVSDDEDGETVLVLNYDLM
ncbi:hypothetical protein NVP1238A_54 [Vibrio phage 1.238.A._10N.261.52.F10]|uniref:Uncharacterized protein n=1 Tax=Vibrio phage 1.238.A._10N.261.52.F10 TaxID=1881231 RepID=A0A2I7RUI2_9CAUD|nr:hypothetical protein KNT79_gp54 [Vibrio phage 1.238.A._10N.261.52.F10]AUR97303.1 hypothetical protein NVP1238A_54 [Vibrio phage 1.238.A._10N.261.52.F10]AUR97397.1 hypothetical protein NVP1238B_55 [Vibrio phage 1.238.B._10N.261.52.F10]